MFQDCGSADAAYMEPLKECQVVGLGTAVRAVIVRPTEPLVLDGAVSGSVVVGRGGMVCNTLAVAAALGARVGGVIASGSDEAGTAARAALAADGVATSFITTERTPVTVTLAEGLHRTSIMGEAGAREPDLDPAAVEAAWEALALRPAWVLLTLPALDSAAGRRFVELARKAGAAVAVTLSSSGHVRARASGLQDLLSGVDLVFGNTDEHAELQTAGAAASLMIATDGPHGATVLCQGAETVKVPIRARVDVVDTTGAGDAFAGGVLSTLQPVSLATADLKHAIEVGHSSAGVIVAKMGAEPGDSHQALREIGLRTVLHRTIPDS